MATEQRQESVEFLDVEKSYPPGELLNISYTLNAELKRSARDWVGLFRVGWSSSRDYYTFEWAPFKPELGLKGEVTFAGRRLPPEDNHFYQFCYVTSDGRVQGASSPFQFLAVSLARVDDLELIEVGQESLLILQPIKKDESEAGYAERRNELLKIEKEKLVKELELVGQESEAQLKRVKDKLAQKEANLKEKDEKIAELERQLVIKEESETRLMEKLERERALNENLEMAKQETEQRLSEKLAEEQSLVEELTAAKSAVELQVAGLKQTLTDKDTELKAVKEEYSALQVEVGDLKGQLQIKNAQVEDLGQLATTRGEEKEQLATEAEQLQGKLLEVQQIRADLIEDVETKQVQIDQLNGELAMQKEENEQLNKVIDELKQDVACAQENVAELVGARQNAVVINQPTNAPADHDEPPTQAPPTQATIIDKAAYDALLGAYENLEDSLTKSKQANRELANKLQNSEIRSDEMIRRLQQAKGEYHAIARENVELKRRGGRSPQPPNDKPVDRQIKEMESINKELVATCEVASQELSARKEEVKQKQIRIGELEQELAELKAKHEDVVLTKNEALEKQQAVLDEKLKRITELQGVAVCLEKEKEKSEAIVHQLRGQLDMLKAAAKTTDRSCPVCTTKFPGRISQEDFERHVQAHFETV